MAKDLGSQAVTIKKQERTWRVEVFCDLGNVPQVNYHRQIVSDDGTTKTISNNRVITRSAADIAEMSVTVGKNIYTGAELAQVISAFGDALADDEDAKDAAAAKAKAEAEAATKSE